MRNLFKKSILLLSAAAMTLSAPLLTWAADHDIIILHTNDIHCGVQDNLTFSGVAHLKSQKLAETPYVALVDAGDAIQGAPIGKLSDGLAVVNIMNAVGYDMLAPGNHEYDYGMARFLELAKLQHAGYYCSNFMDLRTNQPVLPQYKIVQFDDTKIAFIGATTPKALSASTPTNFQDGKGNFIYGFCEDLDGTSLYKQLQKSIDAARNEGADYVFIVGHLGVNGSVPHWSSFAIAQNTHGVDGIIDGHSHEQITDRTLTNNEGKPVFVSQTGTKIQTVGEVRIATDGTITNRLIENVNGHDEAVEKVVQAELDKYEPLLKQPIADTSVKLHSYDPKNGQRLSRSRECSLGDFVADALRVVTGADGAIVNGGAIRNEFPIGTITYNDIIEAFPFSNYCAVAEVTGQQLLDCLEKGAMNIPEETGGFMQVSGITYTINTKIKTGVHMNAKGQFVGISGPRRVSDVTIGGAPLDPKKKYIIASNTYILKECGSGMTMFQDVNLLQDGDISDGDAVIEYAQNHLNGKIGAEYANPYGQGRITIK